MNDNNACKEIVDLVAASLVERDGHTHRAIYFMDIALAEAKAEAASLQMEIADIEARQARHALAVDMRASDTKVTNETRDARHATYRSDCQQATVDARDSLDTVKHLIGFVQQAGQQI
ncbi:MAG: hypothetical protein CMP08_09290 [Xanthomonadales bacterium]|nr:hypothetical protein [Xanthomonadales bacterium]|tara:strand:+ start:4158 stop:4511 length:354 start_codon:yes stop_codon:yes gene_type:complete